MRKTSNIPDKEIIERIRELTKDIKKRVSYLRGNIDRIISSKSKSPKKIEKILDELLDYSQHGIGKKEFGKLNDYYFHINQKASNDYNKYYREFTK